MADMATRVIPHSRPCVNPSFLHVDYEKVRFKTKDGVTIAAWWLPEGNEGNPAVVLLHGYSASKEHMLYPLWLAHHNGFPVLALDFRGHGDSDPSLVSLGYHEQKDVQAALEFLKNKNVSQCILWGRSMGAVVALHTAAKHPGQVVGVIADSPYDTLRKTLARHAKLFFGIDEFPLLTLTYFKIESRLHFDINAVDSLAATPRVKANILFLAGEKDKRTPPNMVKSIAARAQGKADFWTIPGEGHEFRAFEPEFCEKISSFLSQFAKSPQEPSEETPVNPTQSKDGSVSSHP